MMFFNLFVFDMKLEKKEENMHKYNKQIFVSRVFVAASRVQPVDVNSGCNQQSSAFSHSSSQLID